MWTLLLWTYFACATIIIVHEIDSAYWKEWELFRIPGGSGFFVWLHLPLVAIVLLGLYLIQREHPAGSWVAIILSTGGMSGFVLHQYFLLRGRPEFRSLPSQILLWLMLLSSVGLGGAALFVLLH